MSARGETGHCEATHWPDEMGEGGCQIQDARGWIERSRLNHRDLMLAKRFADDLKPARQGCIAEGAFCLSRASCPDGRGQRFFRVDELRLRLGESRGQRGDGFTGLLHGRPPYRGRRSL